MNGKLYLCATPIGNLGDITYRCVETLRTVDLIAAEDTRRTLGLLNHLEIEKPLTSYFEHNKKEKGSGNCENIPVKAADVQSSVRCHAQGSSLAHQLFPPGRNQSGRGLPGTGNGILLCGYPPGCQRGRLADQPAFPQFL